MEEKIPEFLSQRLEEQYGKEKTRKIIEGYQKQRLVTLRVNTLKTTLEEVKTSLEREKIAFETVTWSREALILKDATEKEIQKLSMYENGEIYLQSLSSMLPPILLQPKEKETILDMTAAPGSKTTQIAALSNNQAQITACELNAIRAERLKYNIEKQGVKQVCVMVADSRNLDEMFSFDKILLDAPCSGSGTLDIQNGAFPENFTEKLIHKSCKSQLALLKKAIQLLKPGKEMIYSTCSILACENEEILKQVLKLGQVEIVPIRLEHMEDIPLLPVHIEGTLCVEPNAYYEGFFVAKLRKKR